MCTMLGIEDSKEDASHGKVTLVTRWHKGDFVVETRHS